MNKEEREKLKKLLFDLIEARTPVGKDAQHDPHEDETVLEAARILSLMN